MLRHFIDKALANEALASVRQDAPSVTNSGEVIRPDIEGLVVSVPRDIHDERGRLIETFGRRAKLAPYSYFVTIHCGCRRGWEMHKKQTDRVVLVGGHMKWVLADLREESATFGAVASFYGGAESVVAMDVPPGVAHVAINVGSSEASFINYPTHPYDDDNPDKFRVSGGNLDDIVSDYLGW